MPRPSPITPDQELQLIALYQSGVSRNHLAEQFGASRPFVTDCLRRHSIPVRNIAVACDMRRFAVNDDAFTDPISNPEACYWIGFLLADGCISENCGIGQPHIILSISSVDGEHLNRFRAFVGAAHPISIVPAKKNKYGISSSSSVRLDFASRKMADDLAKFGVVPRKSMIARADDLIVSNRDFWRGYIDGNGNLRVATRSNYKPRPVLQLCGSESVIHQFAAYCRSLEIGTAEPHRDKSIWAVALTCGPAIQMMRLLYSSAPVALPRKAAIAAEIIARFR